MLAIAFGAAATAEQAAPGDSQRVSDFRKPPNAPPFPSRAKASLTVPAVFRWRSHDRSRTVLNLPHRVIFGNRIAKTKLVGGHPSDGPSWIDLVEIRLNTTESCFAACLSRHVQQNLPRTVLHGARIKLARARSYHA